MNRWGRGSDVDRIPRDRFLDSVRLVQEEWLAGMRANRARWDECAALHAASPLYDLDGFRSGRGDLRPFELDELGPVAGLELIHLECHLGTDTLCWARHGARVVGVDFSVVSIDIARALAADCGLEAEFVTANVYDAAEVVRGRRFDIVYTGIGALGWLPDLDAWARVVDDLLRPGGVLYVVEIHPVVLGVARDGHTIDQDIFEGRFAAWDEAGGTYAVPDAALRNMVTFERNYAISEVVTPLLDVGLTLELLHEQSYTNAPWPWLEQGGDGYYRLPDGSAKYPLSYSLRARKR